MRKPIHVTLEHIRSFAEPQAVPLRPLTLLVGENSSGKSSFLAVAACVFESDRFPGRPPFNEPPFNLGTFESIATYKGGKYGRDESFSMGFETGKEGGPHFREVKATYRRDKGAPTLGRFEGRSARGRIALEVQGEQLSCEVSFSGAGTSALPLTFPASFKPSQLLGQLVLGSGGGLASVLLAGLGKTALMQDQQLVSRLFDLVASFRSPFEVVLPFAPIRSRPRRTYDDLSEDYSPEGAHVPRVLARLLSDEPQSEVAARVHEALNRFGRESGLFQQVEVKRLGKGLEDPFQVRVGVGGPRVNLMDVGYGVSQALPVLVQSALPERNSLLLIQQPEVHLHPRAQAALGSFFVDLVSVGGNELLIETHSDYLVDRVRQEVAQGRLEPEQVQILFFDRPKTETTVHSIELDACGNVVGAPERYRDFFLQEELKLLRQAGV